MGIYEELVARGLIAQVTNEELIRTLDEVRQIQDDGRVRRVKAEEELARIEAELKQKLLDMQG